MNEQTRKEAVGETTEVETVSSAQKPGNNDTTVEYLRWKAESGLSDAITLRRETAEEVLTAKRMELIETIGTAEIESVRDLARQLDRDVSIVSRDLDILYEAGVVEFETDGRAKKPVLAHETVLIEPIVFKGGVVSN